MNKAEQTMPTTVEEAVVEDIPAVEESIQPVEETAEGPVVGPEAESAEEARPAAAMPTEMPNADDAQEATVSRLADEFLALAEEMEGIAQPEDLPEEVWDTAAQGVPLRDAYLRFWYAEHIRRQVAAKTRERTAAGSAGSLRDLPEDPRPEEAAFAQSFQTAVE